MSRPSPLTSLPTSVLLSCGALTAVAMLMLTAGLMGLLRPTLFPSLAQPAVAWSLIVVGAMLDTGAVTQLMLALRAQRNKP